MTVPRVNLSITRPFARTLVTPQISRLNLQVAAKPRKIGSSWHIGKIRMHAKKKEKSPLSLSLFSPVQKWNRGGHPRRGKLMICLVNICSAICSFSSRFLNRGWRIVTAFVVINIIMQTQWHGELGEAGLYLTRWKFLRWRGGLRGWRGGRGCPSVRCPSRTTRDNCFLIQLEGIREFSVPFRDNSRPEGDIPSPFFDSCVFRWENIHGVAFVERIKRTLAKLIFSLPLFYVIHTRAKIYTTPLRLLYISEFVRNFREAQKVLKPNVVTKERLES